MAIRVTGAFMGLVPLPGPPGVRGRAARISLSVRVTAGPGPSRVCRVRCEFGRQGQWRGPVLAGAAMTASQCRGRASESATTSLEWLHAVSSWARSWGRSCARCMFCVLGLGLVTQLAGRGTAGRSFVALQVRFAGPPPYLVFAGRPFSLPLYTCSCLS